MGGWAPVWTSPPLLGGAHLRTKTSGQGPEAWTTFKHRRWRLFLLQLPSLQVLGVQTRLAAWLSYGNLTSWLGAPVQDLRVANLFFFFQHQEFSMISDSLWVPWGQPSRKPLLHLFALRSVICLNCSERLGLLINFSSIPCLDLEWPPLERW